MINVLCWDQDWQVFDGEHVSPMQPFGPLHQDAAVTWCPQRHVVGVHVFEGSAKHAAALVERKVRADGKMEGHAKVFVLHTQALGKVCQVLYMAVPIEDWQRLSAWEASQSQHCLLLPLFKAAWAARAERAFVIVQGPSELIAIGLVDNRLVHASAVVFSSSAQDAETAREALAQRLAQEVGNQRERNTTGGAAVDDRGISAAWLPWSVRATQEELARTLDKFEQTSGLRCELVCRAFADMLAPRQSDETSVAAPLAHDADQLDESAPGLAYSSAIFQPKAHASSSLLAEAAADALLTPALTLSSGLGELSSLTFPSAIDIEHVDPQQLDVPDAASSAMHTQSQPVCSAFAHQQALGIAKSAANSTTSRAQFLVDSHAMALFVAVVLCSIGLSGWSGYRFWQAVRIDTAAEELAKGSQKSSHQNTGAIEPGNASEFDQRTKVAQPDGNSQLKVRDAASLEFEAGRDLLFLQTLARSDSALDIVDLLGAARDASAGAGVRILGLRFDAAKPGETAQTRRTGTSDTSANATRLPASSDAAGSANGLQVTEGTSSAILDGRFSNDSPSDSRAAAEFERKMKSRGYLVSPLELKGAAASLSESSRLFSYRVSRIKEAP